MNKITSSTGNKVKTDAERKMRQMSSSLILKLRLIAQVQDKSDKKVK